MVKKAKMDLFDAEKAAWVEAVKQRDAQIETLQRRLESSADLTRMIVHDLKGPLASIMANLDMLLSPKVDREAREILETAIQGGHDLLNIINTILEIGKMERGTLELNLSIIDLEHLFKTTAAKLKPLTLQKKLHLEIDCRSRIPSVAADASLIERIIFNLVMNAIRYTREGGTIQLMTDDGRDKDEVIFSVSDTGIGIPHEFHEEIFDLYTRLRLPGERRGDRREGGAGDAAKSATGDRRERRRGSNVGIGLAFCRLAAKQHGGRIWVKSELGKGSTFFVSLPTTLIPSGSGLVEDL